MRPNHAEMKRRRGLTHSLLLQSVELLDGRTAEQRDGSWILEVKAPRLSRSDYWPRPARPRPGRQQRDAMRSDPSLWPRRRQLPSLARVQRQGLALQAHAPLSSLRPAPFNHTITLQRTAATGGAWLRVTAPADGP